MADETFVSSVLAGGVDDVVITSAGEGGFDEHGLSNEKILENILKNDINGTIVVTYSKESRTLGEFDITRTRLDSMLNWLMNEQGYVLRKAEADPAEGEEWWPYKIRIELGIAVEMPF